MEWKLKPHNLDTDGEETFSEVGFSKNLRTGAIQSLWSNRFTRLFNFFKILKWNNTFFRNFSTGKHVDELQIANILFIIKLVNVKYILFSY